MESDRSLEDISDEVFTLRHDAPEQEELIFMSHNNFGTVIDNSDENNILRICFDGSNLMAC